MFVHLVLIKLRPGVTRADPRVPAWEALFEALHDMTDVPAVIETSARHDVDFLPPEAND